jgi:uncharacterized protein
MSMPWLPHYIDHAVMILIALLLIAWLSNGRFSEYGLQWPKGKPYVLAAVAWGIFLGVSMTMVDYLPQILARTAPQADLALTRSSISGWLGFEFIFVGFGEEIPFRGLLQTFLMQRTSGRTRIGKYDMHVAGVILALIFALAHANNFWQRNAPSGSRLRNNSMPSPSASCTPTGAKNPAAFSLPSKASNTRECS